MLKEKDITVDRMLFRIFGRIKEPLTPDAAKLILSLKFPKEDTEYMAYLAERSRAGRLSDHEHGQVESYGIAGSLLGILQAKARVALGKPASTKPRRTARS